MLLSAPASAQDFVAPGMYEIVVTLELPNVLRAGEPVTVTECLWATDIWNATAFRVRSENPIRPCQIRGVRLDQDALSYRVACEQPNSPFADGLFVRTTAGFQGAIAINMGGKNMTLVERHSGRRLGECPRDLTPPPAPRTASEPDMHLPNEPLRGRSFPTAR